jgi:VanZ family protein
VASWRESVSPYSGGTVPDLHRVPSPCSCVEREPIIGSVSDTAPRNHAGLRAFGARHRGLLATASLWLPVVVWAAVIFTLSSVPDLGTGLGGWDVVLRKIGHAGEFAVLGALLARALGPSWPAFAAGVLYAVSDEVHQVFVPGRAGSPLDVAIDAVGLALGVVLWRRFARA